MSRRRITTTLALRQLTAEEREEVKSRIPAGRRPTWYEDGGILYAVLSSPCSEQSIFSKGRFNSQNS